MHPLRMHRKTEGGRRKAREALPNCFSLHPACTCESLKGVLDTTPIPTFPLRGKERTGVAQYRMPIPTVPAQSAASDWALGGSETSAGSVHGSPCMASRRTRHRTQAVGFNETPRSPSKPRLAPLRGKEFSCVHLRERESPCPARAMSTEISHRALFPCRVIRLV